eukprot:495657_1
MALFPLFLLFITQVISSYSLQCNSTNLCSNQIINCTNTTTHSSCNIECTTRESCKNTTIICPNSQDCNITCSFNLACDSINIQCPNSNTGNCNIQGTAPNALTQMNIQCNSQNINQQCNIYCLDHSTCSKALINGNNSLGPLNIICSGNDGCTDITLYCPVHSNNQKLCTISGWNVVGSGFDTVHRNLNIYAKNAWNDIDLSHYIAWVGSNSSMHCSTDYNETCLITNAAKVLQWNCITNSSKCYFNDETVNNIRCDDDFSCNGTDIKCNNNDKPCKVWCTGKYSCTETTVYCANNQECSIICSGENACDSGTVKHTEFKCPSNGNCNIACGVMDIEYTEYGLYACRNAIINCPLNSDYTCDISVYGDSALQNANIKCNGAECNILCNGLGGCQRSIFNGTDASLLNILCMPNGIQLNTCSDMKVICPIYDMNNNNNNNKRCIIGGNGDDHRELQLFCKNAWDDINILNYSAEILSGLNSMNCGYSNYNNSCLLNEGVLKTNSCFCEYVIPSDMTTTYPPIPQGTDWVIIIAVSIACFFFVLFALFCVLFMKKDDEMIAYEIYREKQKLNVKHQDDEKQMELPPTQRGNKQ